MLLMVSRWCDMGCAQIHQSGPIYLYLELKRECKRGSKTIPERNQPSTMTVTIQHGSVTAATIPNTPPVVYCIVSKRVET